METIEYIDAYFSKTLAENERVTFEKRCEEDNAFAQEVAFYITARESLREELLQQKQTVWQTKKHKEELPFIPSIKKSLTSRWIAYAAAACLVLAASVYFFEANTSPKKYAENYIKTNYSNLSQLMSADSDNITLGKAAYNNKDYDKALPLFKDVEKHDPSNADAKKFAGLAYLQKQDYNNALQQFDALSKMKLFSNPGDFLKALTLIERNEVDDKEEAKKLLDIVITEKEEGSEKAEELQKKL